MRLLLTTVLTVALALPAPAPSRAAATPDILKALPAGDAVAVADPARLFGKVLPEALSGLPEYRGKFDAAVASMKADFGLDLSAMTSAGASVFLGTDGSMDWVAVMTGDFGALATENALATRLDAYVASHPKYRVRKEMRDGIAMFALPETTGSGTVREDVAVALVDASTVAYGTPAAVRRALGVRKGAERSAAQTAALVEALALADASAPLRFGMPAPQAVVAAEMKRDPNNPFLKTLAKVRLLFGALAPSSGGTSMTLTARAASAAESQEVGLVLSGLIGIGQQLSATKPELAALFDRMTVTTAATDATLTAKF